MISWLPSWWIGYTTEDNAGGGVVNWRMQMSVIKLT